MNLRQKQELRRVNVTRHQRYINTDKIFFVLFHLFYRWHASEATNLLRLGNLKLLLITCKINLGQHEKIILGDKSKPSSYSDDFKGK